MQINIPEFLPEKDLKILSNRYHVPGIQYGFIRNGEMQAVQTYGLKDSTTMEPIAEDTVFEAASLTKPVFSLAIMKLMDRGILHPDDFLVQLSPEDRVSDEECTEKVTVRHVLSHSSGLIGWGDRPHLPFKFIPGEGYSYSGEGYYWLQHVTERITGRSFCDMLTEEILKPLEMNHSTPVWTEWMHKHESHKFDENGQMMPLRDRIDDDSSVPEPNAAWSLYSCASDYLKFMREIMIQHGHLSDAVFELMISPSSHANQMISWGLGWGLYKPDAHILWHWGDNGGYRSFAIMDLDTKDALCVFTNGVRGGDLCMDLARLVTGEKYMMDVIETFIASAES